MKSIALSSLVVLGLVLGAAANCDMGFDFFSSNVTAGAPCEQCNFPSAWWPASQRQPQGFAAATAVTSAGKSLFKIAVDDTATNPLKLWIRGDNYLLNFNAPIDSTCNPGVPAKTVAAPTRRLKAASNWYVTRTGTYTINWGAGNKPMTNESIATLMEFNAPAGVDDHCINVTVTLAANSAKIANGTWEQVKADEAVEYTVPATDMTKMTVVCVYRKAAGNLDTAMVKYDMCNAATGIVVNLTNLGDGAKVVNMSQNGTASTVPLLRPMIRVWGDLIRDIYNKTVTPGYDQSVDAPKRFLYYKVLDQSWDPSMPISIAIPTSDKINNKQYEEGYYQVNAAISLVSAFPELVSMTGKNSLAQYDQDKAFNIANLWEFATGTPVINAMVGFQQSKTMLSMSNATPKDGSTILEGTDITVSWTFRGVGETMCKHGDDAAMPCVSPFQVKAKNVANNAVIPITVSLTDVCGGVYTNVYTYTSNGVQTVTRPDDTTVMPSGIMSSTGNQSRKSAAASVSQNGFLVTLVFGLALLALL